ncbi:MAG TPA: DUF3775 domain-containing protein [Xanthobacteraceae bacterium]|nr:DUF3775 domain-containing protein [Xanthobacteraceae bacterium]
MLEDLTVDQARFVAILAKAARAERDAVLGHGSDRDLYETPAARGERNPTSALGYDPLPLENRQLAALRDALSALTPAARSELYVLTRIGHGYLVADEWHRGMQETLSLSDAAILGALTDDPDLHDHLLKGLYEARLGL